MSLIIWEMQIEATKRCHLAPVGWPSSDVECSKDAEKGNPMHQHSPFMIRMEAPQKVKNRAAIQPSTSTSGRLFKGNKNMNSKRRTHPRVHCGLTYDSQDMAAAWVSSYRRRDKEGAVRAHRMEYYAAIKKEEILPRATTRMHLVGVVPSERSQTEKDRCGVISLIGRI